MHAGFLLLGFLLQQGLAEKYPGDVGLGKDPAVLLFEDFEDDPKTVPWMKEGGWFEITIGPGREVEVTDKTAAAGKRSLQFNLASGKKNSGRLFHLIEPDRKIHLRYYRKFVKDWKWPQGYGPHDTMVFAGDYLSPYDNDLAVMVDFWQSADTIARITTAKQKLGFNGWEFWLGDRKRKSPLGASGIAWNVAKPDKIVPGKWHCVEVMVKVGTAGKEDGAVKLWVNGKVVSDYSDLPLRDENHKTTWLNMILLGPHFHPGSPKAQTHWADQVVVAKEYIGPIKAKERK